MRGFGFRFIRETSWEVQALLTKPDFPGYFHVGLQKEILRTIPLTDGALADP